MNLFLGSLLLAVGLFQSSLSLTAEECEPLVKPLSLADHSWMYGKYNFITGYSDNEVYKAILRITQSSWVKILQNQTPNEVTMDQGNRINGTCIGSLVNVTLDGDTARASFANVTSSFHFLPTCEGCILLSINSTAVNIAKLLELMNLGNLTEEPKLNSYSVYLMAKDSVVKDSDQEHFRKQASCLGFDGEPDFHYDPKNTLCSDDEVLKIPH